MAMVMAIVLAALGSYLLAPSLALRERIAAQSDRQMVIALAEDGLDAGAELLRTAPRAEPTTRTLELDGGATVEIELSRPRGSSGPWLVRATATSPGGTQAERHAAVALGRLTDGLRPLEAFVRGRSPAVVDSLTGE
jgi:hypothetical protein